MTPLTALKSRLYAAATADPDALARAAAALLGGWPEPDREADFLDFFAIEWVGDEGLTLVERLVAEGALPPAVARWSEEVRTALWVVDGWEGDLVLLRDVATEDEVAVRAPGAEADLPRRTVLRARVVPWEDGWVFSGEPDVYEGLGVIGRMDLLRAWQETPEPGLLARLSARRAAYRRLREEREAWLAHFGADERVFDDAAALGDALARFVSYLLNEHPFPSLGGATRAQAWREAKGDEPAVVRFELGPTLTGPGRHGAVYDPVEGIHFLPRFGELLAHLGGEAEHPEVVRDYLDDPGITALPFRRAQARHPVAAERLAALVGAEPAPMDELLARLKPPTGPVVPSVLPGLEDG